MISIRVGISIRSYNKIDWRSESSLSKVQECLKVNFVRIEQSGKKMPIKLKPDDISTWIYFQDRFESQTTVLDIFHIKCNVAVMLEMDKFVKEE